MFQNNTQIILKVTRDCNLRCKYCYIENKEQFAGERLKFEDFKKIVKRIIKEKKSVNSFDRFQIVFHGGEPTIIGRENLRKMFDYATNMFDLYGIDLNLSIQTNLTLLDDDFCRVLKDYGVSVGCSFDGFGISNTMRSSKSTKEFIEKLKLMRKHGVSFGYLTVVNNRNFKSAIKNTQKLQEKYYDLDSKNARKMTKVNIVENILTDNEDSSIEIDGEEYFKHITKPVIDKFIAGKKVNESNTEEILKRFIKDRLALTENYFPSSCGSAFCGSGKTVMTIDATGDALLCGRFSKHFDDASIGNVFKKDFLEINQIRSIIKKTASHNRVYNEFNCDDCVALPICTTGCEAFHYSKFGEWGIRKNIVCNAFIPTMKYLLDHEYEILKRYALICLNNKNESANIIDRRKRIKKLKSNNVINKVIEDLDCKLSQMNDYHVMFESKRS